MRISACVITKNEEKNIEQCLASYKDFVDEIILVDTGSTDNTVNLAKALGAKTYFFEWCDDFSAAKNYALEQATGDWIIFLDADEYFQDGSAKRLNKVLKQIDAYNASQTKGNSAQNTGNAVSLVHLRKYNIDALTNKSLGYETNDRVFRSNLRYQGKIHETLYSPDASKTIGLFVKDVVIIHTGYSVDRVKTKHERNIALLLKKDGSERGSLEYYYIASDYLALECYEKAYEFACKSIAMPDFESLVRNTGILYKVLSIKIQAMSHIASFSDSDLLQAAKEALAFFPEHPELKYFEAYAYFRSFRLDEALTCYFEAIKLDANWDDAIHSNTFTFYLETILFNITQIHYLKQDYLQALEYGKLVLTENPRHSGAFAIIMSILHEESASDILAILNKLYPSPSLEDILFILSQLNLSKAVEPFLYYYDKLSADDIYPVHLLSLLLYQKEYAYCSDLALSLFDKTNELHFSRMSTVSLLLLQNKEAFQKAETYLYSFHRFLLNCFFNKRAVRSLDDSETNELIELMRLLMHYSTDSNAALDICLELLHPLLGELSPILFENFSSCNMYNYMTALYTKYSASLSAPYLLTELSGYYWKQKSFALAAEYLEKALQSNIEDHLVIQFIKWLYRDKDCDADTKNKLASLLDKYNFQL